MLHLLSNQQKIVKKNGGFGIEILFPGKGIGSKDSGIGTIGRIDQARVTPHGWAELKIRPLINNLNISYATKDKSELGEVCDRDFP
jgi:hypothetical protein